MAEREVNCFQCTECAQFKTGPSMHYLGVSKICKNCYALFQSVNNVMKSAKW